MWGQSDRTVGMSLPRSDPCHSMTIYKDFPKYFWKTRELSTSLQYYVIIPLELTISFTLLCQRIASAFIPTFIKSEVFFMQESIKCQILILKDDGFILKIFKR